jgi:hypothetical protein
MEQLKDSQAKVEVFQTPCRHPQPENVALPLLPGWDEQTMQLEV